MSITELARRGAYASCTIRRRFEPVGGKVAVMRRRPSTVIVVTGAVGVLAGVLVFVGVAHLSGSGKAPSRMAPPVFVVGKASAQARLVNRYGPLLFQDPVGGGRDIYVQHLRGDSWRAFQARAPGAPRRCQLRWRPPTGDFVDPCNGHAYPADGSGLTSYPTSIDRKGNLTVDLRSPQSPA